MFEPVFAELVSGSSLQHQRFEGVAFFKAARSVYPVASLEYLATNIPIATHQQHFAHCTYSDTWVKHCITDKPLSIQPLMRVTNLGRVWQEHEWPVERGSSEEGPRVITFPLRPRFGEVALFGISIDTFSDGNEQAKLAIPEFRVLANYFHSHVLRINGHDSENEMLVSARELDCLRWTAAGKTAWEASVILGISERTVRFHLNAAREKLNCTTTTQAVAKAVARHLINVSS